MNGRTYINTTCKIGQGQECGRDAVWVIAVTAVTDTPWANETREGGVVALCEFHATTAVTGWDATSAKDASDRSGRIREAFERSSFGTPAARAARESVSDQRAARVVKRAEELAREFCPGCDNPLSEHPPGPPCPPPPPPGQPWA